jgi:hypothetical protein
MQGIMNLQRWGEPPCWLAVEPAGQPRTKF